MKKAMLFVGIVWRTKSFHKMSKFYFTLGYGQEHDLGDGRVWDRQGMVTVEAENEEDAIGEIVHRFGRRWCNVYNENPSEHKIGGVTWQHFPKGVVLELTVK